MHSQRAYAAILISAVFLLSGIAALGGFSSRDVAAQELVTSTPVRAELPTLAPPVIEAAVTATPSRTPTPEGQVLLEAKAEAGEVNVRAEPDIEGERLGTIRAGRSYQVFGRYFRWLQFQFDDAPTGPVRAWVFDELVQIIGDESAVPNLEPGMAPTTAATLEPAEVLTLTPGGFLTATASARTLSLPGAELSSAGGQPPAASGAGAVEQAQALPTYTYPPVVAAAPTTQSSAAEATSAPAPRQQPFDLPEGMPPIAPILLLGALGLAGLAVSSLRR
ncbi:MAG: hypothetical protein BroJett033_0460 [Chloroflexota bacterium]|nr:MAG: hypothetical protein BroJett033_0460 [Chloroflexota bacterium]